MNGSELRFLTVEGCVERLHAVGLTDLNAKWVQDQISRGKLPRVIIARKRRVRSDKLDEFIKRWMREAA